MLFLFLLQMYTNQTVNIAESFSSDSYEKGTVLFLSYKSNK